MVADGLLKGKSTGMARSGSGANGDRGRYRPDRSGEQQLCWDKLSSPA